MTRTNVQISTLFSPLCVCICFESGFCHKFIKIERGMCKYNMYRGDVGRDGASQGEGDGRW